MNIRTLIDEGLQRITNWRHNMVKKQRYPKVGKTKAKPGTSGRDVCGACGSAIVQVKANGTRACSNIKCGKKAT